MFFWQKGRPMTSKCETAPEQRAPVPRAPEHYDGAPWWRAHSTPDPESPPTEPHLPPMPPVGPEDDPLPAHAPVEEPTLPGAPVQAG
jgi:hypothetical protein